MMEWMQQFFKVYIFGMREENLTSKIINWKFLFAFKIVFCCNEARNDCPHNSHNVRDRKDIRVKVVTIEV